MIIFEQNNYIKSRLSACLEGAPGEWHIVDIKNDGRNAFDIAVVTKNIPDKIISPILICPAEMPENLAKRGRFGQIVTGGYSSGDTVTFSSMGENDYHWGSNMELLKHGMTFAIAAC